MALYLGDSKVLFSRIGSEAVDLRSPLIDMIKLVTSENFVLLDSDGLCLVLDEEMIDFGGE